MLDLVLGITVFTGLVLVLTAIILTVRAILLPSRDVTILVNEERELISPVGDNLLDLLTRTNLYLASACGGKGTCGQCKVAIEEGGGPILPTETSLITRKEISEHIRLACQVIVKDNMRLRVPDEVFGVKRWTCRVRSNRNVSTLIKEIILELPAGETIGFKAGSYILVECPPCETRFKEFVIEPEYKQEWDRNRLWDYEIKNKETLTRAYSMANHPGENTIVMLNVRIALPPPGSDADIPPGIVSSYLFNLRPGDKLSLSGPFGHFFARETENEMIFIGGGAGMAPMRSHILDQLLRLKTKRRISFWYGARNKQEIFYQEEFDKLQEEYANFNWHIALSDPKPEDDWSGYTGFIHKVIYDNYLLDHPAPEDCEYYLCGPPMMNTAVIKMLEDLGVEPPNIMLDDFGS